MYLKITSNEFLFLSYDINCKIPFWEFKIKETKKLYSLETRIGRRGEGERTVMVKREEGNSG